MKNNYEEGAEQIFNHIPPKAKERMKGSKKKFIKEAADLIKIISNDKKIIRARSLFRKVVETHVLHTELQAEYMRQWGLIDTVNK